MVSLAHFHLNPQVIRVHQKSTVTKVVVERRGIRVQSNNRLYEQLFHTKLGMTKVVDFIPKGLRDSVIWVASVNGAYALIGGVVGVGDMIFEVPGFDFEMKKKVLLESEWTLRMVSVAGEKVGLLVGSAAKGVISGLSIAAPIGMIGGVYLGARGFTNTAADRSLLTVGKGTVGGVVGGVIGALAGRLLTEETAPQIVLVSASFGAFFSILQIMKLGTKKLLKVL